MEFVKKQYWSDGLKFHNIRSVLRNEQDAPQPVLRELTRWLAEEEPYSCLVVNTGDDPTAKQSLVEWRKKVMKVVLDEEAKKPLQLAIKPLLRSTTSRMEQGCLNGMAHRVRCVETGIEYETVKAASRATGATPSCIRKAMHCPEKTAGGYHWESVSGGLSEERPQ